MTSLWHHETYSSQSHRFLSWPVKMDFAYCLLLILIAILAPRAALSRTVCLRTAPPNTQMRDRQVICPPDHNLVVNDVFLQGHARKLATIKVSFCFLPVAGWISADEAEMKDIYQHQRKAAYGYGCWVSENYMSHITQLEKQEKYNETAKVYFDSKQ